MVRSHVRSYAHPLIVCSPAHAYAHMLTRSWYTHYAHPLMVRSHVCSPAHTLTYAHPLMGILIHSPTHGTLICSPAHGMLTCRSTLICSWLHSYAHGTLTMLTYAHLLMVCSHVRSHVRSPIFTHSWYTHPLTVMLMCTLIRSLGMLIRSYNIIILIHIICTLWLSQTGTLVVPTVHQTPASALSLSQTGTLVVPTVHQTPASALEIEKGLSSQPGHSIS
jgi:hypothetical protein